jgi:glycosyltransferase involved in cell wall biosynthesis
MKEGWGITIIEANACGTPCIAYDVPGLRDSIVDGKTGILIKEDGNVEKLAEAMISVLKNEKLRETFSDNALKWSRTFSWDKSAEKFEEVIKNA